ncbi:MAG: VanZ family protein [Bacteroidales bacterium]|nr:VanZ family protein [Bacteroidales bacterium]
MISRLLSERNLFATYLLTVVLLMVLPLNSGEINNTFILHLRGDYLLHAILFLPWAFLRYSTKQSLISWFFRGILLAAASEGIQYLLPYRAYNVNDLLANLIGIFLSTGLWWLFGKIKNKKP